LANTGIACDGAAPEIEAEPLEEATERKDVDESIDPNVAPKGFLRAPLRRFG
jgi:hypothetical protein